MKKWYKSRGIWLGIVTVLASLIQMKTGLIIDGQAQGAILGVLVIIVRLVTSEEVEG